jgi:hypothetical protein
MEQMVSFGFIKQTVHHPIEEQAMNFNPFDISLIIAATGIILCPTLCGIMAYRISRTYTASRNAG